MLLSYLPIMILLCLAIAFPLASMVFSSMFGPKVYHEAKLEPYECGVPPVGNTHRPFAVHFYKIAILFLLFDIEAALLFPWAVMFKHKFVEWGPGFLIGELLVFIAVLMGGYMYAWKRGILEWE